MLFTITGKHIEITERIRSYAEGKTSKLPKYYSSINQTEVIIDSGPGGKMQVEIIARAEHNKVFVVADTYDDVYKGIDAAVHKLERQLARQKGKERDNKYKGEAEPV